MFEVAIIDYGIGNLLSVSRAFEHCGAKVKITSRHEEILNASHVVLPGVGAFEKGMIALKEKGLDQTALEVASKNIPLFAICLGMQMLLDESEEFGINTGLGLIPGKVIPIPKRDINGKIHKIPHIGWNTLIPHLSELNVASKYNQIAEPNDVVYFVHSFMATPTNSNHRIADTIYGGIQLSSIIGYKNIIGCQFHPEKSGRVGLNIIRRFLNKNY